MKPNILFTFTSDLSLRSHLCGSRDGHERDEMETHSSFDVNATKHSRTCKKYYLAAWSHILGLFLNGW